MQIIPDMKKWLIQFIASTLNITCATNNKTYAHSYDLLLKGEHVLNIRKQYDGTMDLEIGTGRFILEAPNIPFRSAKQAIDFSGRYVSSGFFDIHVLTFEGTDTDAYIANELTRLPPDGFTFRSGVTTVVDAASSGWRNFPQFRKQNIDKSNTRNLAFLNIARTGMVRRFQKQDTSDMNPQQAAYMIKQLYPKILDVIKTAHYWGDFSQVALAVKAGKLTNVPLKIESMFFQHLRPEDIFTHSYSNGPKETETEVDENGNVKPFVQAAQKRSINFDVGHVGGAISRRRAVPAMQQVTWNEVQIFKSPEPGNLYTG